MARSFVAWFIAAALGWFGVDIYVEGKAKGSVTASPTAPAQYHAFTGDGFGLPPPAQ
jgi:hypothetical protein